MTLAIFQLLGKLFVYFESFSNLFQGFANTGIIFLSIRTLSPSYPKALLQGILFLMSKICLGVYRGISKTVSAFNIV